ncbi:DUF1566 domain-containing protein [Vibrio cholerae]|uniref:Lcl C-terminal domain-containing protein n=1 Tax=Vibrio cholerae TaxID=666 RepID=UPI0021AFF230|nr:DUF1566 domain-containing protein [Vibrio cholerae]
MMKKLFLPLAALTITACQPEPNVALRIDCGEFNDQGVAITLNGKPIGDCPLDIMTHAGQTDISVNKTFADASYLEGSQSVMLAENVNKRVKFDLQQIYGENYYYKKITTIADAREYLKRFPQGQYAQQVSENIEYTFYEKTTDLSGMNEYLNLYPEGRYAREINKKRELFYVEKATSVETAKQYFKHYPQGEYYQKLEESFYQKTSSLQGMNDYLELYPKGKNAIEVSKKLEAYYFDKSTTIETAREYLKRFPQGKYVQQVKARIETFPLIANRYYDNLDGTVFDKQTQLVWMRCSLGQSWDGKNCTGKAQEISWDDAIKLKHNFAGSTAWRLPTVEELDSLVYCSKGRKPSERPNGKLVYDTDGSCLGDNYQRPTINIRAFPNTSNSVYWSSSPNAYGSYGAWYVDFDNGYVGRYDKDYLNHVRLVRAGQ